MAKTNKIPQTIYANNKKYIYICKTIYGYCYSHYVDKCFSEMIFINEITLIMLSKD